MGAIRAKLMASIGSHPNRAIVTLIVVLASAGGLGYWMWQNAEFQTRHQAVRETLDKRDWKAAQEVVKKAMEDWPGRPEFVFLAARVERRLENLDQSKKHLDNYQNLVGGETQSIKVERALLRLHAGAYREVEPFLRACIRPTDPDSAEILDLLSAALEINHRVAEAQQCLDELLKLQPQNFDALVRRGRTARTMGWFEDAAHYFEKALAIRPDVDAVRMQLAESLGAYGNFDKAQVEFVRLLTRKPDNASFRFGLGLCYAGTGQSEKAKQIFDELIAVNPNNWSALLERGKLAVQLDMPEVALADLIKADSLAPPSVAPTQLINCLRLLGRLDEARKYQDKSDRILADRTRTAELGDLLREKPSDDPEPRYELGVILLRLGEQREGVHWLRAALEKDPRHRKSHEALAEFFQSVGAIDLANQHRRSLEQQAAPISYSR